VKLSALPVSLYADLSARRRTLGDWFTLAARASLDGADVSALHVTDVTSAALASLRQQAADNGIAIAMLATYTDFTHPDAKARARQTDALRAWIDVGARLGAQLLRVTAGQDREGVDQADGLAWAAEGLTACLDEAVAAGILLLYENHVRGAAWTANDFTQPAARFLDVARRTRGSGLGVLFDTANNLALDEDPIAVLDAVLDRVGAVHVSDIRYRGTFEPTTLGTGVSPIPDVLARVAASGFDGWISIEEASRTGDDAFARAVRFTDGAWVAAGGRPRPVAKSEPSR
jgi:sugar phosphate isomerase/epimerase